MNRETFLNMNIKTLMSEGYTKADIIEFLNIEFQMSKYKVGDEIINVHGTVGVILEVVHDDKNVFAQFLVMWYNQEAKHFEVSTWELADIYNSNDRNINLVGIIKRQEEKDEK